MLKWILIIFIGVSIYATYYIGDKDPSVGEVVSDINSSEKVGTIIKNGVMFVDKKVHKMSEDD